MPARKIPEPKPPMTRIEMVFEKLGILTDRVIRNDWNDRVCGRFSTTSKIDEDYEPVKEDDN